VEVVVKGIVVAVVVVGGLVVVVVGVLGVVEVMVLCFSVLVVEVEMIVVSSSVCTSVVLDVEVVVV